MRLGLKGNQLPESKEDFVELVAKGGAKYLKCHFCDQPLEQHTHTKLGWAETQISGSCEECFDSLFDDED